MNISNCKNQKTGKDALFSLRSLNEELQMGQDLLKQDSNNNTDSNNNINITEALNNDSDKQQYQFTGLDRDFLHYVESV